MYTSNILFNDNFIIGKHRMDVNEMIAIKENITE